MEEVALFATKEGKRPGRGEEIATIAGLPPQQAKGQAGDRLAGGPGIAKIW
jgi:hypothetical protein